MPLRTGISIALAACFAIACGRDSSVPAGGKPGTTGETPSAGDAAPPEAVREAPRLALWVLCEGSQRVLERPERIPELIETARALGASDLFVQVYRQGRAWFDSTHADADPFVRASLASGVDPLAELLSRAQAAGLRVHAWVNVLSLGRNREAPLLTDLGPGVLQVDRLGRSLLDYPDLALPPPEGDHLMLGTPGLWLDPAAPGVADRLAATFAELVERYAVDGLHLDYIRYPDVLPFSPGSRFRVGLDFGYGEAARARFEAETGLAPPFRDARANANRWDRWRRDRLTDLVRTIRAAARATRPEVTLSAAVWAYPARAYLSLFQDWRGWLEAGLLELAVPMLYSTDDHLLRQEAHGYAGGIGGDRLWIGLGAWLFQSDPERAVAQLRTARAAGAPGQALFSYDAIAEAPALRDALAAEAARIRGTARVR